ncbi:MAG: NADH:ubiquinone reductase (Na(+)-transporting) subunit B [Planctomycetota bacterium]
MLDKVEPLFEKGGPLEKLYPLYEANDTFLYTPGEVTHGSTHVRDALDTKRMMTMVIIALLPCIFMAMYNTGYQAQKVIYQGATPQVAESVVDSVWDGSWRFKVLQAAGTLDENFQCEDPGPFLGLFQGKILSCVFHGALYFLPVYLVCMVVGGHCELIFSVIRKHEINEGFLVTGMLFPLTLPPTIPLWQVAVGIIFGVVIGKEIFGGTGRNFLNPALTARAFLYFAYPTRISGDAVWTAVDGYTGATVLGAAALPEAPMVGEVAAGMGTSWLDFFIGNCHGSMGETSALCAIIGAVVLILAKVGSWRIMAGSVAGMSAFSLALYGLPTGDWGNVSNILPWWHLVIGGFAFGTVFMATDPVSASMTRAGKWWYGGLIGFMTVLVRCINPAFPEGIMLAILFANVFAPFIDWCVVQSNIKRRTARYVTAG